MEPIIKWIITQQQPNEDENGMTLVRMSLGDGIADIAWKTCCGCVHR
jgi:hypothetical protein